MTSTFLLFFAGRLQEERKRLGLNQDEVADAVSVSRAMYGRYERAIAAPGAEVLALLLGLGFDLIYVMTGQRPAGVAPLSAEETVVLEHFRAASKDVRRAVLGALTGGAQPGVDQRGLVNQNVSGSGNVVAGGNVMGPRPLKPKPT